MTPSMSRRRRSCLPIERRVRAMRKIISIPYKRKQSITLQEIILIILIILVRYPAVFLILDRPGKSQLSQLCSLPINNTNIKTRPDME